MMLIGFLMVKKDKRGWIACFSEHYFSFIHRIQLLCLAIEKTLSQPIV